MKQFQIADILFEDADILVCQKHAGMAVQSARSSQMDLESALKNYLVQQQAGTPYLHVIHRLDQPVEGILVFAKTPAAAKILNQDIARRKVEKYYLAMVSAKQVAAAGTLEDYLLKDGRTNTSKVVSAKTVGAKRAVLDYKLLKQYDQQALVEIQLHTGRHHQIRVQMAAAKMPLCADRKYNPQETANTDGDIGLCAYRLKFRHPRNGKELVFEVKPENSIFAEGE